MEAAEIDQREDNDKKMAGALAAGHDISSSEDEDDAKEPETVSPKVVVKESPPSASYSRTPVKQQGSKRTIDNEHKKEIGKPMCAYGTYCIRKNPQHFREYHHRSKDYSESSDQPPTKKRKIFSDRYDTFQEVLQDADPFNFMLTKVRGIPDKFNNKLAVNIKDILAVSMGNLVESAQFNYMHDIPWLMQQYPPEHRSKPLLIVHGEDRQGKISLHEAAHNFPNVTLCQAKLDMLYGTHHSKMMLLIYTNGLRVVIHTANLVEQDWDQKTQGVWISPLFPKLEEGELSLDGITADSVTHFKRDLVEYLSMYKSISLMRWKKHILQHDFTSARVFLIASIPGRHTNDAKSKWGHMKVRKILSKQGPDSAMVRNWSAIGQFSSVGSLGADQTKYLCGEWLQSMLSSRGVSTQYASRDVSTKTLKLIFPTIDNVRTSLEGYKAGASIPYNIQNARRQEYFHTFLHKWKASNRGRSRASPHLKSYSLLSPDSKKAAWFMVTSANMSKAAWGMLEKNSSQLMIRSYEIGVLFLPHLFDENCKQFSVSEEEKSESYLHFPLPWDVPLEPYTKTVSSVVFSLKNKI
ncbi:putative tyrosyl-DNA phosphodiesterase 1-like [Apostichopus japonicus]|uniref:Putative tyrosyl-DNA phosphodiesterase 1-like n=1 Tax=Stichopus japonicus TaxID=307972 RepID=A0A2G8KLN3_STIJA|nr:putative tyrosyl-DNA phosphodiesterase 1-like [Apostichopus japonicus]